MLGVLLKQNVLVTEVLKETMVSSGVFKRDEDVIMQHDTKDVPNKRGMDHPGFFSILFILVEPIEKRHRTGAVNLPKRVL